MPNVPPRLLRILRTPRLTYFLFLRLLRWRITAVNVQSKTAPKGRSTYARSQRETKNSAVAAVTSVAIACLIGLTGLRALATVFALFLFLLLFLLPLRLVLNFFFVSHGVLPR